MDLFYCLIFFALSWFVLTGIFKYSTNVKYFVYMIPVLAVYGWFAAYVLHLVKQDDFFYWYIGLIALVMAATYRNKKKAIAEVKGPAGYEQSNWLSVSLKESLKYFVLNCLIYLVSFAAAYLFLVET